MWLSSIALASRRAAGPATSWGGLGSDDLISPGCVLSARTPWPWRSRRSRRTSGVRLPSPRIGPLHTPDLAGGEGGEEQLSIGESLGGSEDPSTTIGLCLANRHERLLLE